MELSNHDIDRFIVAQNEEYSDYSRALCEIRNGRKTSHWIWYIFPQLRGLGSSYEARFFGIADKEEAYRYLTNPVLRERLYEITKVLLEHQETPIEFVMGSGIDALKLRSCMTLFDYLSPHDVFEDVLNAFYEGRRDEKTLEILAQ